MATVVAGIQPYTHIQGKALTPWILMHLQISLWLLQALHWRYV